MSLLMLVIETFMLDPAKLATNCVRASGSSIRRSETSAFLAAVGIPPAGIGRDHNTRQTRRPWLPSSGVPSQGPAPPQTDPRGIRRIRLGDCGLPCGL